MHATKRIGIVFLILLLGLFLSGFFPSASRAASGKTRVAVIDFEQKAFQDFQGKQIGEIVAEWMITALANTGRFEVVERAQLQKVMKEQQLGISGMINQETAAKVGELLGVKVIVSGAVIQIGNTYDVNARLISVEDGSIIKAERVRGVGMDGVEQLMFSLAQTFMKEFPLEGYVVMVSGKRAMIDLGRINGIEPGMRFYALRKGAPIRHRYEQDASRRRYQAGGNGHPDGGEGSVLGRDRPAGTRDQRFRRESGQAGPGGKSERDLSGLAFGDLPGYADASPSPGHSGDASSQDAVPDSRENLGSQDSGGMGRGARPSSWRS
jgi:TolB-like protein